MLYDILARDLHGAIEAMEAGNIELRSAKLKHGFLALQQLEGSLNMDEGGETGGEHVPLLFHAARADDEGPDRAGCRGAAGSLSSCCSACGRPGSS